MSTASQGSDHGHGNDLGPANHPARWLVKSGERVTGPFSKADIQRMLRSKEIVVIDEVKAPLSRWRYVRDEPAFAEVVEEIRKGQMSSREDTEVQGHTTTATHTATNPDAIYGDLLEPTQSHVPIDSTDIRDAEIVDESTDSRASTTGSKSAASAKTVRQYGVGTHQSTKQRNSRLSHTLWLVAFIFIVGAACVLYGMRTGALKFARAPEAAEELQTVVREADSAWQIGRFQEALKLYRRADQLLPNNPTVTVRMAILMMKLEGQTLAAKRILQQTADAQLDRNLAEEVQLGLGLASLMGDELAEARRRYESIIRSNPRSDVAHFDLGVIAVRERAFRQAIRHIGDAINISDDSIGNMFLAKTMLDSGDKSFRPSIDEALEKVIRRSGDFRQEALVMSAYLSAEAGSREMALQSTYAALSTDPELTSDHVQSPFVVTDVLDWKHFLPLCNELNSKVQDPATQALLAVCLVKSGLSEQASEIVEKTLVSDPENALMQSVNAYILSSSGRDEEARGALRLALSGQPPLLATYLQARICAKTSDKDCEMQAWDSMMGHKPKPLAAMAALARLRLKQGQDEEASRILIEMHKQQGLTPRYSPYLQLRHEMEMR